MVLKIRLLVVIGFIVSLGCRVDKKNGSTHPPEPSDDCLEESVIRSMQTRYANLEQQRFQAAVLKITKKRGSMLRDIAASMVKKRLPFGVPQRYVREDGTTVIAIGTQERTFSGIKVASTKEGGWLVFVSKPNPNLRFKTVRACKCKSHGGIQMVRQPPPAVMLPVSDMDKVEVVEVIYTHEGLKIQRTSCPGLIP